MTSWMSRLLAKSPFGPLQEHMKKVVQCARIAPEIIEACLAGQMDRVRELAKELSRLEREADDIKRNVRDNLPRSLFMPVSRGDLLKVLSSQDDIADCAEDLGVLLTMRPMEPLPEEVERLLRKHTEACLAVVDKCTHVLEQLDTLVNASFSGPEAERVLKMMDELSDMEQLDKLVEASFSGPEAQRVLALIDLLDQKEHQADKVQDQLAKIFFKHEDEFKPAALYVWMKVFNKVGDLANHSKKVAKNIRLFMAK